MTSRNARKSDAILELMPNANRLVLIHMKRIVGIVVLLEQLDKGERFGKLVHCALRSVQVNAANATFHDVTTSFAN